MIIDAFKLVGAIDIDFMWVKTKSCDVKQSTGLYVMPSSKVKT